MHAGKVQGDGSQVCYTLATKQYVDAASSQRLHDLLPTNRTRHRPVYLIN
jgi:hypothetical protein